MTQAADLEQVITNEDTQVQTLEDKIRHIMQHKSELQTFAFGARKSYDYLILNIVDSKFKLYLPLVNDKTAFLATGAHTQFDINDIPATEPDSNLVLKEMLKVLDHGINVNINGVWHTAMVPSTLNHEFLLLTRMVKPGVASTKTIPMVSPAYIEFVDYLSEDTLETKGI